jgi:hypothetical protein
MKPTYKYAPVLLFALLMGCDSSPSPILSYEELKNYPTQCEKAEGQLKQLRQIQAMKNFDSDPDNLNEEDRLYNGRLKATIWWYAYECSLS